MSATTAPDFRVARPPPRTSGGPIGQLPQRSLEDGGAAPATLPNPGLGEFEAIAAQQHTGHAVCVSEAPEVFAFDADERKARILTQDFDGASGEALRPRIEAAIRYCPTMALRFSKVSNVANAGARPEPSEQPEPQGD